MGALRACRGFTAITGPRFPDYNPQRMRGIAMDSHPLRLVPIRILKIDLFFVSLAYWNTLSIIILRAALIVTVNNKKFLIYLITC